MGACARGFFVALNTIFILGGIGAIAVGIYGSVAPFVLFGPLAYTVIAIGGLILFLALLGCCSAIRMSAGCSVLYFIFVLLFVLGEVGAVIAFFVVRSQLPSILRDLWADLVSNVPQVIINFEQLAQCCGYNDPSDLRPPNDSNCHWSVGCKQAVEDAVSRNVLIVLLVGIALVILQVIAMVLACVVRSDASTDVEERQSLRSGAALKRMFDQPPPAASGVYFASSQRGPAYRAV